MPTLSCASPFGHVYSSDDSIVARKVFLESLYGPQGMQHIQDRFAPCDFDGVSTAPSGKELTAGALRSNPHLKQAGQLLLARLFSSREKLSPLEADLRAELQDSRIARSCDLAEGAGAERGVQRRIVGVVESIECFHPELG